MKIYANATFAKTLRGSAAPRREFAPKSQQTYNNVKEVWDRYPLPVIATGHILVYWLMQKSLTTDRGNDYLGYGLHSNFIQDFINTNDGVALVEHI